MCQIVDRGISIHALLAESDSPNPVSIVVAIIFLSTLSLRRATRAPPYNLMIHHNFYPRSPCGERLKNTLSKVINRCISIHALLAESDSGLKFLKWRLSHFYPRSPCGERLQQAADITQKVQFLSTLSLRRATRTDGRCCSAFLHFYPRSPCGERLCETVPSGGHIIFLSTLSLRRATLRL